MTKTLETPSSSSPETQQLIEGCLALSRGETENHQVLISKAEIRLAEMNEAMDGLFAQVDSQGPDFYQEYRHHFEHIEAAFHAYGEALEQILASAAKQETDFYQIATELAHASEELRVGMARYEEDFMSRGPSRYPIINLFDNVARAVREERTPQAAWDQTCERYLEFYSSAIEEIESSSHQDKPGIEQRKSVFTQIVECLGRLREFDHGGPVSQLESLLSRLSALHVDLESAFDTYHHHEFSVGPTKGPKINWIIKAAEGVLEGTYRPEILATLAQDVLDVTQSNLAQMRELSKQRLESVTLNEELAQMIEAAEGVEDALTFLIDFADDSAIPPEQVREAVAELTESADLLVESTELVKQYNETAGKVTCVQCQTTQQPGARVCAGCGAQLPSLPGTGAYSPGQASMQVREGKAEDAIEQEEVMTDVMKALFDACEEFLKGKRTFADLDSHLARNLTNVNRAMDNLSQLASPVMPEEANQQERELSQGFIDLADDALATLEQGVALCRAGLEQIAQGARAQDPDRVQEGMAGYYQGTQKMWAVKRLDHELTQYIEADDRTPEQIAHSHESVHLGLDQET